MVAALSANRVARKTQQQLWKMFVLSTSIYLILTLRYFRLYVFAATSTCEKMVRAIKFIRRVMKFSNTFNGTKCKENGSCWEIQLENI